MGLEHSFQHYEVEGRRFGRFGGRVNTTCIVYRIGTSLIDTGPPNQWRQVRHYLREKEVSQVLITHAHEDHSGNARAIQRQFQAELLSHPEAPRLICERHFLPYQKWIWGVPESFESQVFPETIQVGNLKLKPVPCPGHSEDLTCLLEPERGWLFSGDLYVAKRTRYARLDEDPVQEIKTLKVVLQLDFETLFCAHRGVVPEGKAALVGKLAFLEEIYQQSREAYRQGQTIAAISEHLLGRNSWLHWLSSGDFSKQHFIRCCLRDLLPEQD